MAGRNNTQHADYKTIRAQLMRSGTYFKDPEFPPDSRSLYFNGRVPSKLGQVVWKRAKDLCRNPMFIEKGANRNDMDQGELGDCWFIAAAASLATDHKKLFEKVVPPDQDFQQNYTGMFYFHFWWYGKWKEVVVDDYLPANKYGLIFCRNLERPNEFWPALLEKAYVKLRGCVYESLQGGQFQDAMVDLTGCISEVIDLKDRKNLPPNLYDLLQKSFKMKSMLGCCIFNQQGSSQTTTLTNGLITGHAYSITGFQQLKSNRGLVQLLRIRNPWGSDEWTGPWSDKSREIQSLPENIKEDMRIQDRDEGEFWMSYEDLLRNFEQVQLCHLQVDAMVEELEDNDEKQNWTVTMYHDEWIRGVTAGGCGNPPDQRLFWKNPQFEVDLKKPDTIHSHSGDCTMIVSLMKQEETNKSQVAIGFRIYRLNTTDYRPQNDTRAPENALKLEDKSGVYMTYRECTRRFQMPPGKYVIIPSTFKPHEELKFMLRIFTEKFAKSRVIEEDDETPLQPVLSPKDFVFDIFRKYCGSDNCLDAEELQKFLVDVSEEDVQSRINFNKEQCRSMLPLMDENCSGRLEFQEAKKLWKEVKAYRAVFLQFDNERSGFVDTFELSTLFRKLSLPISRPVLTSIVRRYGDRENRICLEDFIVIIMRLIQLFNVFIQQERKGGRTGMAEFSRNEFLQHTMYL